MDWSASRSERPLAAVPLPVRVVLAVALLAQILWHALQPAPVASASALPEAPSVSFLEGIALGEPAALARILMLWLQAFDHQPGLSISFRELDYGRVIDWLDRIVRLEPRSHYALLSAARVYSEVQDDEKKRLMIAFVRDRFIEAPDERWPWVAHAVYVAKHRLEDPDLALQLAADLRTRTSADRVPSWARQMELFILADMGETEAARFLLGAMIVNGVATDPNEIRFLQDRIDQSRKPGTDHGSTLSSPVERGPE
ncbi:MAG: hypothetical protein HYY36_01410 [Gammaproteobacteria bacterium]|nr:hypothetical protein [Gammaproteobacteria bacterium]